MSGSLHQLANESVDNWTS